MSKKKILVVGNKPSTQKIDYSDFDIVCHINRMNNILNLPKVDIWYCDCHEGFFKLDNNILESQCNLTNTLIYVPYCRRINVFKLKSHFPQISLKNIMNFPFSNKMSCNEIGGTSKIKNILTSDVIFLKFIIEKYDDCEIYLSYMDVYDRGNILSQQESHNRTWHENAVYDEEKYLKKLIEDGKIKYIPDNNTIKENIS